MFFKNNPLALIVIAFLFFLGIAAVMTEERRKPSREEPTENPQTYHQEQNTEDESF